MATMQTPVTSPVETLRQRLETPQAPAGKETPQAPAISMEMFYAPPPLTPAEMFSAFMGAENAPSKHAGFKRPVNGVAFSPESWAAACKASGRSWAGSMLGSILANLDLCYAQHAQQGITIKTACIRIGSGHCIKNNHTRALKNPAPATPNLPSRPALVTVENGLVKLTQVGAACYAAYSKL